MVSGQTTPEVWKTLKDFFLLKEILRLCGSAACLEFECQKVTRFVCC